MACAGGVCSVRYYSYENDAFPTPPFDWVLDTVLLAKIPVTTLCIDACRFYRDDAASTYTGVYLGGVRDRPVVVAVNNMTTLGTGLSAMPTVAMRLAGLNPLTSACLTDSITVIPGFVTSLAVRVTVTTRADGFSLYRLDTRVTGVAPLSVYGTQTYRFFGPAGQETPDRPVDPTSALVSPTFVVEFCPTAEGQDTVSFCIPVPQTVLVQSVTWQTAVVNVFALLNVCVALIAFLFPYRASAAHRLMFFNRDPTLINHSTAAAATPSWSGLENPLL